MNFSDESANTLRYAAQAKKIVNIVVVNENPYIKMIKKVSTTLPLSNIYCDSYHLVAKRS